MSWKHTVEYPHNWPAPTRAKAELMDIAKYVEVWARKHQYDAGTEEIWKAVESIKKAVYWLQYAEACRDTES